MNSLVLPANIGISYLNFEIKTISKWKVGGKVRIFVICNTLGELQNAIKFFNENGINWIVIGNTSNILFADRIIDGAIIKLGYDFKKIKYLDNSVNVGSAVFAPCFSHSVGIKGYTGFEHIIGIPGLVGGLVNMNAGSSRKSIADYIRTINFINEKSELITVNKADISFTYRNSIFNENNKYIITEIIFDLIEKADPDDIINEMLQILKTRKEKFPLKQPNCGSVFKSNEVIYEKYKGPGKIIELLGMKGFSYGGAKVSDLHANFIVNENNASASDILFLIRQIQHNSSRYLNIKLETEIKYIDNQCRYCNINQLLNNE